MISNILIEHFSKGNPDVFFFKNNVLIFQTENGPNGPPLDDEIPIDGYLPILIAAGIFIIFSMKNKKKYTRKI